LAIELARLTKQEWDRVPAEQIPLAEIICESAAAYYANFPLSTTEILDEIASQILTIGTELESAWVLRDGEMFAGICTWVDSASFDVRRQASLARFLKRVPRQDRRDCLVRMREYNSGIAPYSGSGVYLTRLAIPAQFRNHGVGSLLLIGIVQIFGGSPMALHVAKENFSAIKLYRKCGFEQVSNDSYGFGAFVRPPKLPSQQNTTETATNSVKLTIAPPGHFKPRVFDDLRSLKLDSEDELLDVSVSRDGFRYDCRLNRRGKADHLIVALHGGVANARAIPALARWTQHAYFRAPILSVFDPLLYEHPGLPGGWFVGDLTRDATESIAEIVRRIASEINIEPKRVVFVGNSSGGFAAIRLASTCRGAKFISINGQTRIVDYRSAGSKPFSAAFDPSRTPEENAIRHEKRWSTPPMLEDALRSEASTRGVVIQNVNDAHHFESHYKPFCLRFGLSVQGDIRADRRLRSVSYEGEHKHEGEPPIIARRIVNELIPELLE